jgi:hypothetical protein
MKKQKGEIKFEKGVFKTSDPKLITNLSAMAAGGKFYRVRPPTLDLNALFTEIKNHKTKVNNGNPYWPHFAAYLSEKYMKPLDKRWGKRTSNGPDPYTDVLH